MPSSSLVERTRLSPVFLAPHFLQVLTMMLASSLPSGLVPTLASPVTMPTIRRVHLVMDFVDEGVETKAASDSIRPDKIDLEAAAASQAGIADGPPLELTPPKPIVDTMMVGDGKLAGDIGFDPLGLADTSKALAWYREAEVKHARLAMLAAVGWPISEKLNEPLSSAFGQDSMLVDGRAPSLANGGLDKVSVVYWLLSLGIAIAAENSYLDRQLNVEKTTDYVPGMIGLDPLNLDGPLTRLSEIWYARGVPCLRP